MVVSHLKGYIDVSHTSHTTSNTGIQRVTRSMVRAITKQCDDLTPITYDPFQDAWRPLERKENDCLFPHESFKPGSRRRPRWTTRQRIFGVSRRPFLGHKRTLLRGNPAFDFILFPEIIDPEISAQFTSIKSAPGNVGPRIGVFHDAIAWKFPQWSAKKTFMRYPEYMRSLAKLDGIATVSNASKSDLLSYWDSIGVAKSDRPEVRTIYLGSDPVTSCPPPSPLRKRPIILCVATLEARKNHLSLLSAAAHLWHMGYSFELELIGGHNRETGVDAVETVQRFRESGFPVKWHGAVSDAEVEAAYQHADFVVYPSLYEGFGLPVIEALRWGKPVLTTPCGSLNEVARSGGCLVIEKPSAREITEGLKKMLKDPDLLYRLQREARSRKHRNWDEHATDVLEFVQDVRMRKLV